MCNKNMVLRSSLTFIFLYKIVFICAQDDLLDTLFNSIQFNFENKNDCLVQEKKTGLERPCEFPFIYENKTYYGCSTYVKFKSGHENFNDTPWCSTRTEPISTEHITGGFFWGHCPQDGSCLTSEEGQIAENFWETNELSEYEEN